MSIKYRAINGSNISRYVIIYRPTKRENIYVYIQRERRRERKRKIKREGW